MTATIIDLPSLRSTREERAAERELVQQSYAEIVHIAQCLQPDVDVLDIHRAGVVWRGLRRTWHAAGEPDTFTQFADRVLATISKDRPMC